MIKKYILVTDDEPINLMILEEVLEDFYEVGTATDGLACLNSVEERRPDLILMDVHMPVMSGIEATNKIKALEGCQNIPIIMVSALASEREVEQGLSTGVNGYITKPFKEEELLEMVDDLFNGR